MVIECDHFLFKKWIAIVVIDLLIICCKQIQAKIEKEFHFYRYQNTQQSKKQQHTKYHISNCKYTSSECYYLECFFRCLSLSLTHSRVIGRSMVYIGHRYVRARAHNLDLNTERYAHMHIRMHMHPFIFWQKHIHFILMLSRAHVLFLI